MDSRRIKSLKGHRAVVRIDGRKYSVGSFDTPTEALDAFIRFWEAAIKLGTHEERAELALALRMEVKAQRLQAREERHQQILAERQQHQQITKTSPSTQCYLLWHSGLNQYRMTSPKYYTSNLDDAARFTETEACDACLANPKLSMRPAP